MSETDARKALRKKKDHTRQSQLRSEGTELGSSELAAAVVEWEAAVGELVEE